jgi:hypothetical protein
MCNLALTQTTQKTSIHQSSYPLLVSKSLHSELTMWEPSASHSSSLWRGIPCAMHCWHRDFRALSRKGLVSSHLENSQLHDRHERRRAHDCRAESSPATLCCAPHHGCPLPLPSRHSFPHACVPASLHTPPLPLPVLMQLLEAVSMLRSTLMNNMPIKLNSMPILNSTHIEQHAH